ncbi:MAG: hypothetical protein HQL41_05895 [Alphaproteobacteria bacterium]|nr:hypothetical protein [Alphaproteobacteria bacterium]
MPKQPANWPIAALPRRLTREWAAFYCGLSPNTFDTKVKSGEYPAADRDGKYDVKLLDKAIDQISGLIQPEERKDDWTVRARGERQRRSTA